ncbi:MAG: DUF615 domain-containing protein [Proteobacteria bacterium]|nr:DUF615 domain-containing protein [Pseudomonadota bacterium]
MSDEHDKIPSRSQRKREADRLQAVGEKILGLTDARLAQLPLPDALRQAIEIARKLTQRGALRRQRQYIGRLMRELDVSELEEALQGLEGEDADDRAVFHAAERWRDRLVMEGMPALEDFFNAYPAADRQRLRQLVVAIRADAASGKAPRRHRELFREIRPVVAAGFEQDQDTGKMHG